MILGVSIISAPVFEADKESIDSSAENEAIMFTEDEFSSETMEALESLMLEDEFQIDSIHILGELGGDTIYVEVTDETTVEPATSTYSSNSNVLTTLKTFSFYKEVLGNKVVFFKIRIGCSWIKGQKILAMVGKVVDPKAGVSYKWNDIYKKQTDVMHTIGLDFSYGSQSGTLIFTASIGVDRSTISITM